MYNYRLVQVQRPSPNQQDGNNKRQCVEDKQLGQGMAAMATAADEEGEAPATPSAARAVAALAPWVTVGREAIGDALAEEFGSDWHGHLGRIAASPVPELLVRHQGALKIV